MFTYVRCLRDHLSDFFYHPVYLYTKFVSQIEQCSNNVLRTLYSTIYDFSFQSDNQRAIILRTKV